MNWFKKKEMVPPFSLFVSNFYPILLVCGRVCLNFTALNASVSYDGWYAGGTTVNFNMAFHNATAATLVATQGKQTIQLAFMEDRHIIKGDYVSTSPSDSGTFCIFK